jgi:hypothetical protein
MELHVNNQWTYKNNAFLPEDAAAKAEEGYIGFIYLITDNQTNKKYIGKKLLISRRRLPPLKGKKRKRLKIVETDWNTYFGSSESVQALVAERIADFSREILYFCKSKGELSYVETREHFAREVLLSDEYMNNFISCKIHGKHVASLRK